jgi:hypothetical protein
MKPALGPLLGHCREAGWFAGVPIVQKAPLEYDPVELVVTG